MNYSRAWLALGLAGLIIAVGGLLVRFGTAEFPQVTIIATPTPDDKIMIDAPVPGATVTSPLKITGRARGPWYFEATFPIVLTDWDGKIIAQTHATAQGDWMTTEWVPFEATIVFDADTRVSSRGALILKKDNPSGDPKYDDSREITIFFK